MAKHQTTSAQVELMESLSFWLFFTQFWHFTDAQPSEGSSFKGKILLKNHMDCTMYIVTDEEFSSKKCNAMLFRMNGQEISFISGL